MAAAKLDFTLDRGDTQTVIFEFGQDETTLFPLNGSEFVLTVYDKGTSNVRWRKSTAAAGSGLVMSLSDSRVTYSVSREESIAYPYGAWSEYTLARVIGEEHKTLLEGTITLQGRE